MFKFLIGLIITIVAIASLMLVPSTQQDAPKPWEIDIQADGNPKIFNIHLGQTSYEQAEEKLHEYGETAAFTEEGKPSTVEAFFNSVHLGGLDAKVVLNISVDENTISKMLKRANQARIQPSGARQYILGPEDNKAILKKKVIALTYIPSVSLDKDVIVYRFGKAQRVEHDKETGMDIFYYPSLGLQVKFKPKHKTVLQYQTIN